MDLSGDLEGLLAARPRERVSRGRLRPGTVIENWRIEAFLGAGRSAEVYRVTHVRMGGDGALKLLVDASYGLGARFEQEMDVLRTLAIPSLPRFFAAGTCEGRPFYVMEYLQPLFLPLARGDVVPFMLSLAASVGALHAAGFIHRDLKPANILCRKTGEPVLIDLGLIKRTDAPAEVARTDVSIVNGQRVGVGTRGFAAPEQLLEGKATVRSDVYALGKVMRACGGKSLGTRARAVIRKAVAEDPEERYPSAEAFADALRRCQRPTPLVWGLLGAGLGSFLACCVFFCAAPFLREPAPPPPAPVAPPAVPPVVHPPTAVPAADIPTERNPGESDADYLQRMLPLAEAGDGLAQCIVGEAYFHGRGTDRDYAQAVRWYASAAASGQVGAQASLGLCNLRGWGCEQNSRKAAYWFHRAAKAGNLGAMVDLAFCYHTGVGVARDDRMAFDWAMKAAQRGHMRGQCMVGEFYLDGYGVEKDQRRADDWLQRAARQGDERAQELLRTR